ncbi:MAG: 5'-nucleotidase, lipoprotein e(P4) family [Schwartzia sp.]|nr:5'-nucleotidase, lipoprotein e(P4) family [Schwartzia sp. (in: firmicutes)]
MKKFKTIASLAAASFIAFGGMTFGSSTRGFCEAINAPAPAKAETTKGDLNNQKVMGLLWMQTAAEYRALCYQAYNIAARSVDDALAERESSGDDGLPPPAIVTDIDEAILDNTPEIARYIYEKDFDYMGVWMAWCAAAEAEALPGAVDCLNRIASQGVEVFYVTNRNEANHDGTIENLKKLGFPCADDDHLLLKTEPGSKQPRFDSVTKDYDVIFYMGDNAGDWPLGTDTMDSAARNAAIDSAASDFGTRFIAIPNPVYGAWEKAMIPGWKDMTPEELLEARKALIKSWQGFDGK